jgi:hypothetical protein
MATITIMASVNAAVHRCIKLYERIPIPSWRRA